MAKREKAILKLYHEAALCLHLPIEKLETLTLSNYLEKMLRELKTERFFIARKYGISTIEEMEKLYREKRIEEKESWEDFFTLDHLEAEIDDIEKLLEKVSV